MRKRDRAQRGAGAATRTQVITNLDSVHSSVSTSPAWEFLPTPGALKRQLAKSALTARTENIARRLGKTLFALKKGVAARKNTRRAECVLLLKRAEKCRPGQRSNNDYDVFDGGRLVGRILWNYDSSPRRSWAWSIILRDRPRRRDHGYAVTYDIALEKFKARWDKLRAVDSRFST